MRIALVLVTAIACLIVFLAVVNVTLYIFAVPFILAALVLGGIIIGTRRYEKRSQISGQENPVSKSG